jgi:hypothetical protein
MNQSATAEIFEQETRETQAIEVVAGEHRTLRYVPPAVKPELKPDSEREAIWINEVTNTMRVVPPAIWRAPDAPADAFQSLQRWEGVVTKIEEDSFIARLTDLSSEGPEEEVELPLADIPAEDRDLLESGAVFYWAIGYRDEASGQRQRVSALRFRRLPVWSASELRAAKERAGGVAAALGRGEEPAAAACLDGE